MKSLPRLLLRLLPLLLLVAQVRNEQGFAALGLVAAMAAIVFLTRGTDDGITEGDAVFTVDDIAPGSGVLLKVGDMVDVSQNGIQALKEREGLSLTSYPDHKGRSIGYGHLIRSGESFDEPITQETADALFSGDIEWAVNVVADNVTVNITQGQFDALVSFAYNVGASAFKRSTLLQKINAGDATAPGEFARWVYAGGAVNNALVARRESEVTQFLA